MLNSILTWLVERLLAWLLATVTKEAQKAIDSARAEKAEKETDDKNTKKYQEAKSREERIKAAQNLLSGTPP